MPISASQRIRVLVQDQGYARSAPRGVTLPRDVARRVSYPVLRKQKQSLHMCAQDVQITRTITI
jgi:hypothetical protein